MRYRIFLNYASEDRVHVEAIYNFLSGEGFSPWMDSRNLIAGEQWEESIRNAIKSSRVFLACISEYSKVKSGGMVGEEIRDALKILRALSSTDIFLIPLRLTPIDPKEFPDDLSLFQWVDWYLPNGRDRLLTAIRESFARTIEGIASLSTEPKLEPPLLSALAIDLKFIPRGSGNELLHLQSERNFDIRTNEAKLRTIESIERGLPNDRSRINSYFCLLGDHLIGRYDYYLIEELLAMAAAHRWGGNRYIVINKRIGYNGIVHHDHASLFLWFNHVRNGAATDILEVNYESRCPDALQLSKAMDRSVVRYQRIQGLAGTGEWKCVLAPSSREMAKFLDDFRAPGEDPGNIVIIVESRNHASQTRLVNSTLDKYPGRNFLIAAVDVEPSPQLSAICRNKRLQMIECRGPFELRYLLLQLKASPPKV